MSTPKVAIAITADDKTAKGVASAEKRVGGLNRQGALGLQRYVSEVEKANARAGRGVVATFSRIERASAGVLGSSGGMGGIVKRMSSLATVGEIAASSMGEAAMSGGVLAATLGTVATGGAIVVGTLAAVGLATDKMASSWAKGVLGAANLAATIGVATQKLQEFQAAGERVGVDKNTSAGALAGLAKTLDDARYGQNANAAGTLALLGIKTKLNANGQVDTAAMLPAIAAAIAARPAYQQRKIANNLGIGEAALPMFRQGPGALGRDMADAGRYAATSTVGDEAAARRWVRERARVGQMTERAMARAGATAANFGQGALDAAAATGASMIDNGGASILKGAGQFTDSVVHSFVPAVERLATAIQGWQEGGRFDKGRIGRMARGAMPIYRALLAHGDSPASAAAWAAAAYAESGGNPHAQQPGKGKNLGYGLFQWDAERRALFQKVMGRSIYGSSTEDQLRFRDYELAHKQAFAGKMIAAQTTEEGKGAAITRFYERPKWIDRDSADRANLSGAIGQNAEVHHHHHITIEDKRVRIKTSSPGAKQPAIFQQITD